MEETGVEDGGVGGYGAEKLVEIVSEKFPKMLKKSTHTFKKLKRLHVKIKKKNAKESHWMKVELLKTQE